MFLDSTLAENVAEKREHPLVLDFGRSFKKQNRGCSRISEPASPDFMGTPEFEIDMRGHFQMLQWMEDKLKVNVLKYLHCATESRKDLKSPELPEPSKFSDLAPTILDPGI